MNQILRLKELIEFAQQTALLRVTPIADVSRHGVFLEYEQDIVSLPGVYCDTTHGDSEDEIWLLVERLQESPAPKTESILLNAWLVLSNNPANEPSLRPHIEVKILQTMG